MNRFNPTTTSASKSKSDPKQNAIASTSKSAVVPSLRRIVSYASSSSSSNQSESTDDTDKELSRREQDMTMGGGYGLKEEWKSERTSPKKAQLKRLDLDPFGKVKTGSNSNLRSKTTAATPKRMSSIEFGTRRSGNDKGKEKERDPTTPAPKKPTSTSLAGWRSAENPLLSVTPKNPVTLDKVKGKSSSRPLSALVPPKVKESTSSKSSPSKSSNTSANSSKTRLSTFSNSHGFNLSPSKNSKTSPSTSRLRGPEAEAKEELWMRSKDGTDLESPLNNNLKKRPRESGEEEAGKEPLGKRIGKKEILDMGTWALARSPSQKDGKLKWIK